MASGGSAASLLPDRRDARRARALLGETRNERLPWRASEEPDSGWRAAPVRASSVLTVKSQAGCSRYHSLLAVYSCLRAFNIRIRCRLIHCLSTRILVNRFNGLETFDLSLVYRNPRSRFMLELKVIFVSISAASLVQWWARRCCSSSIASFEDRHRAPLA